MKKNIALITAVVVLGAGAYFSELRFLSYSNSPAPMAAATLATPVAAQGDTLAALSATPTKPTGAAFALRADDKSYNGVVKEGATVLDAMSALASVGGFQFTSKNFSGMGAFIESINGKQAVDGYYWILYINGKQSVAGASQTHVIYGDSIEWRYEKGY